MKHIKIYIFTLFTCILLNPLGNAAHAADVTYCTVTTEGDYAAGKDRNYSGYLRYWIEEAIDNGWNQCAPPSGSSDKNINQFGAMVLFETSELPSSKNVDTVTLKRPVDASGLDTHVAIGNWTPEMLTDTDSVIDYTGYVTFTKDYGLVVIDAQTNFDKDEQPFTCDSDEMPLLFRNVILTTNGIAQSDVNCVGDAGAFDVCSGRLVAANDVEATDSVSFTRGDYACIITDGDGDGFTVDDGDCNDNDANINPGAEEICGDDIDNDCDGRVDEGCFTIHPLDFDKDDDGYYWFPGGPFGHGFGSDCNDNDASINPGAEDASCDGIDQNCDGTDGVIEICTDSIDNDCDGLIDSDDDDCAVTAGDDDDDDGDGYCDESETDSDGNCTDGSSSGDCDDTDANIHPGAADACGDGIDQDCSGADGSTEICDDTIDNDCDTLIDTADTDQCGTTEICDGIDNNSDGAIDEGFPDTDVDGVADCIDTESCDGVDNNGDGTVDEGFVDTDVDGVADCIDENGDRCNDGIDNDADGLIDCGTTDGTVVADDECATSTYCNDLPSEEICNDSLDNDEDGAMDCLDSDCVADPLCSTGGLESTCDGLDNDADGLIDEGYTDTDADGTADCIDIEICDGVDNNGDGKIDEGFDANDDGISDCVEVGSANCTDGLDNDLDGHFDCNDASCESVAACNCNFRGTDCPTEIICDDGLDDDNDGAIDCADGDCVADASCVEQDADSDGYRPSDGDCNDADASIHPGATELCSDSIDNNCDQVTNEGCTNGDGEIDNDGDQYCEDTDGDGICADGTLSGDCDDANADVNPGATEATDETFGTCSDDVDQNCDGIDAVCDVGDLPPGGINGALTGNGCGCDLKSHSTPQSVPLSQLAMGLMPLAAMLVLRRRSKITDK